jgi:hypothetical protein
MFFDNRILDYGFKILGFEFEVLGLGYWVLGYIILGS